MTKRSVRFLGFTILGVCAVAGIGLSLRGHPGASAERKQPLKPSAASNKRFDRFDADKMALLLRAAEAAEGDVALGVEAYAAATEGPELVRITTALLKGGCAVESVAVDPERLSGYSVIVAESADGSYAVLRNEGPDHFVALGPPFEGKTLDCAGIRQSCGRNVLAVKRLSALRPKIVVANETVDIGKMARHQSKEAVFRLRNDGEEALHVFVARTNCECTVATSRNFTLTPGEEKPLRVSYASKGEPGPRQSFAFLETNDPSRRIVQLWIKSEIVSDVRLYPSSLRWQGTDSSPKTLLLSAPGMKPFHIERFQCDSDAFEVRQAASSVDDEWLLTVVPKLPNVDAAAKLEIWTNAEFDKHLEADLVYTAIPCSTAGLRQETVSQEAVVEN